MSSNYGVRIAAVLLGVLLLTVMVPLTRSSTAQPLFMQELMDQCFGPTATGTWQQTGQEIFPAGTYSFIVFYNNTDFQDTFGWYPADNASQLNAMIPNDVGASITLDIPVDFGLYLDVIPRADWPTGPYTLRSQQELNQNGFIDNFFTFDVDNNATVVAVEDAEPFPDYDFNDAVMLMVPGDSIALPDCSPDSQFDAIWIREFGTGVNEGEVDVATHSSGVYVSGFTAGAFSNQTNAGDTDAFIKKFDSDGNELWTVQFGTSGGDSASAIAVDDSGVYTLGRGIGIYKFDHDGNLLWNEPIDNATAVDVSVDDSGVYVVGNTEINLPGATQVGPDDWTTGATPPLFLRKYDPMTGAELYTVQWGVGETLFGGEISAIERGALPTVTAVDVFSGAVYVAGRGWPDGSINPHPGAANAHVDKLDVNDGSFLWSEFLGPPGTDAGANAAEVDASPLGIFLAGTCCVAPGAAGNSGSGYLAKLDEDGNQVFVYKFTNSFLKVSRGSGMAVNDNGIYVTGSTGSTSDLNPLPQYFLKKFDFDGNELASTDIFMFSEKVATDSSGVYVAGTITESFPEFVESEQADVRLIKYGTSTAEANLTINSVDLSGAPFTGGLWTVIRSSNGTILEKGFTPLEFEGTTGATYKVTVSNFDDKTFDHWQDNGSTERTRTVTLTSDTTLTAIYDIGDALRGFTPLTYTGTEEQPDLTVNAISLDGEPLHMWVIIDPQLTNTSGTTYKVYAGDYQDKVFSHWDDFSTDRVKILTISENKNLTAYYVTAPGAIFHQKTVLEVPGNSMSARGVDAQFTCPDGSGGGSGNLFSFYATNTESGTTGVWSSIGAAGGAAGDRGAITNAVVNSTNFTVEGTWDPVFDNQNTGGICSAPIPSAVTIEGTCGNDVIVRFSAANGVTGTFRGNVTCAK